MCRKGSVAKNGRAAVPAARGLAFSAEPPAGAVSRRGETTRREMRDLENRVLDPFGVEPLFRRYLWGGRKLKTALGKPIGDGDDYAESWELVDRGADQSVMVDGARSGQTLHELMREDAESLLGHAWARCVQNADRPAASAADSRCSSNSSMRGCR